MEIRATTIWIKEKMIPNIYTFRELEKPSCENDSKSMPPISTVATDAKIRAVIRL